MRGVELQEDAPGCRFALHPGYGLRNCHFDQYATAWVETMIAHLLGPLSSTR